MTADDISHGAQNQRDQQSPQPEPYDSTPPPHSGRAARAAWRTGWVLLALVSMAVAYVALVYRG
ncbi:hypothetical protein ACIQVK_29220 [Streptomyces sp. NPDC090493]|uniref:hypothetical protein n=1 Tax=Streptomyces sp. NPDC090493 TaxID=3365964 RepID=UPI003821A16B